MSDHDHLLPEKLAGSRWLLPLVVFLLLATFTVSAWRWQSVVQSKAIDNASLRESAALTAEIRDRLRLHAQFLRSLHAFATSNANRDLGAWRRFTNEVDIAHNLGGLFAFAYAPLVHPAERERFLAEIRQKVDRDDFSIYPPPGESDAAPIVFIAPDKPGLRPALGYNLLSESVRREAIESAIASHDIAMSGRVTLVVDSQARRPGFMLVQAIYHPGMPLNNVDERRQAFAGLVLTAYHTDEFLNALNRGLSGQYALQIYDDGSNDRKSQAQPPVLIFDTDAALQPPNTPILHHEIDFGGRNWILHFRLRDMHDPETGLDAAQLILVSGLLGSALLAMLVFYLTTHRERAEQHALRMTDQLRRSEERIRLATAGTNDGLWDQNLQTGEEYISARMGEIFGFPAEQVPQQLSVYLDCIHPGDVERRNAALRRHYVDNVPFDIELRIAKLSGERSWIRMRGEAIRNASGQPVRIAGSVSDISGQKESEARVERMRRLLATAIAAMPLPVLVQDTKHKLQMVNTALCDLLERDENSLLTQFWPAFDGISPEAQRRLIGAAERALSSGRCDPVDFEFQRSGHAPRALVARIAQAQNPEGEPFLITTLADVTELLAAETAIKAADHLKQSVLDAATEVAIIATDASGLITIFNRGAEKMLGYASSDVVGKESPLLFHLEEELASRGNELKAELDRTFNGFEVFTAIPRTGRSEQRDWTMIGKNGQRLTASLVVTAQRDLQGRISGYLAIAIDVSEQKKAERELEIHRDHLQEMVAERTRRLDTALRQAQAANVAKSEFLANMSHELRTPMHAILSFSELGEDRAEAGNQAKMAQYFGRIAQSAKRLLGLINDLLDLAKLEAGRLELELGPVDILSLLRRAGGQLESLIEQRQLTLLITYDTLVTDIIGDRSRIAQVIHNLLSNAIKFSPEGGAISIHLSAATLAIGRPGEIPDNQPALAIRFSDSGVGIPDGELESIFEKFVQSTATKTGAGGTGLGLAISREIVLQHRGTIVAENNAGGGASFIVTLPINLKTEQPDHHD